MMKRCTAQVCTCFLMLCYAACVAVGASGNWSCANSPYVLRMSQQGQDPPPGPHLQHRSPIVIAGTAGSGTRVLSNIVESGHVFMGVDRNAALDSAPFGRLVKPYVLLQLAFLPR
eukprot:TRINITY_DN14767_c0_g1_i1.p1 TRINITY_DN14767_c0_g1~~TRINITY_DN14767_c0_g1_i1.p1  ORF type:complete len:115 (-),score=3.81 TRINITY_DN14767_c0_g1_i1:99-443(-)